MVCYGTLCPHAQRGAVDGKVLARLRQGHGCSGHSSASHPTKLASLHEAKKWKLVFEQNRKGTNSLQELACGFQASLSSISH